MRISDLNSGKRGRLEMPPVELIVAYAQECALVVDADGWHLEPAMPGAQLSRRVLEADLAEGGQQ